MEIVLSHFPSTPHSWSESEKIQAVRSAHVERVVSLALGPPGTNIAQAAERWHQAVGIEDKAETILVDLPETGLIKARELDDVGTLSIFWTCAVFARLHQLFFEQPDVLPFFFVYEMQLNEMQLASKSQDAETVNELMAVKQNMLGVRLASHVSPAPLLNPLATMGAKIIDAQSNATAAEMCRNEEVEGCITTESARTLYKLETLHVFGSPPMIFYGGITGRGLELLR